MPHLRHLIPLGLLLSFNLLGDAAHASSHEAGPEIPFTHLSSQAQEPFLFLGKAMDKTHARWKQYRKAIRRYPSVRECLEPSERRKEIPDIVKIDWKKLDQEEVDVCVFRIARSLEDPELISDWLRLHGFHVGEISRMYSASYKPRNPDEPVQQLQATWTLEQYRSVWPSWVSRLTGFDQVLNYSLHIQFSEDGTVVHTRGYGSTK